MRSDNKHLELFPKTLAMSEEKTIYNRNKKEKIIE